MLSQLLDFIITGILSNINIAYFLSMLLVPEFVKEFTHYNSKNRTRWFKFDKKARFKFRMKKLIFIIGLILGFSFYYFQILLPEDYTEAITQLIITYIIVTTTYDLLFHAIIKKFREILKTVGDATVKPMEIDLVDDFDSGLDDYWYGDYSVKEDDMSQIDSVGAYDNKRKEMIKHQEIEYTDEIEPTNTPNNDEKNITRLY